MGEIEKFLLFHSGDYINGFLLAGALDFDLNNLTKDDSKRTIKVTALSASVLSAAILTGMDMSFQQGLFLLSSSNTHACCSTGSESYENIKAVSIPAESPNCILFVYRK